MIALGAGAFVDAALGFGLFIGLLPGMVGACVWADAVCARALCFDFASAVEPHAPHTRAPAQTATSTFVFTSPSYVSISISFDPAFWRGIAMIGEGRGSRP